jgi:ankyrin repeat protein
LLIAKGADVNVKNKDGSTPLHEASFWWGKIDVVEVLIAKGAAVNVKTNDRHTPLHWASLKGHIDVVKLLIAKGADVNVKNKDGTTPLHKASEYNRIKVVKLLIAKGADVNVKNKDGDMPLHWASREDHIEVVKLLIAKGANVNVKDKDGDMPLHWARRWGHIDVVKLLIAKGADVNVKDKFGNTPLDMNPNMQNVVNIMENAAAEQPSTSTAIHSLQEPTKQTGLTNFYTELLSMPKGTGHFQNKAFGLIPLIDDLHMMKLFYTAVSMLHRAGELEKSAASKLIKEGLSKTSQYCVCEDSIGAFKMINKKALADRHITTEEFEKFKGEWFLFFIHYVHILVMCTVYLANLFSDADSYVHPDKAVVKRMSEAEFVRDITEAVKSNTARIEGLEANVEAINESVNAIRKGIKRKMKVEAAVGFISGIINMFSLGAGGSFINAASAAVLESIVDFGDIVHIESIAVECDEHMAAGHDCVDMVNAGKAIAELLINGAVENLANRKLEKAVKEGNTLIYVSALAVMNCPPPQTSNEMAFEHVKIYDDTSAKKTDPVGVHFTNQDTSNNDQPKSRKAKTEPPATESRDNSMHSRTSASDEDKQKDPLVNSNNVHASSSIPHTIPIKDCSSGQSSSCSESIEFVEQWLKSHLPYLQSEDICKYSTCLVKDGFDSIDTLDVLEEDDLGFMKIGHRRVLMRKIVSHGSKGEEESGP